VNTEKFLPLLKGYLSKYLGYKKNVPSATGGTINSRYCYAVWLRHLIHASPAGFNLKNSTVAELGPGDSLGTGLAALLCGCDHYYALDIFKYWNAERNLKVFDELIQLFKDRTPIPGDDDFPRTIPKLKEYKFPSQILSEELLAYSMNDERIAKIRSELSHPEAEGTFIRSYVPWNDRSVIEPHSVDLLFSQAVLQSVNDLENTYAAMSNWLKKDAVMCHSIDFSSVALTKTWNGHWTFSDKQWSIISEKTVIPLNRATLGEHKKLLKKYQFHSIENILYPAPPGFSRKQMSVRFKNIDDESFATRAAFMLSKKS
jgi:hypothetical protein